MKTFREQRCRHCGTYFLQDYRNFGRHKYCTNPACRKASKASSQKRWLEKNPEYFSGSVHVERVRQWRKAHPGARRGKTSGSLLQDPCPPQHTDNKEVSQQQPPVVKTSVPVLQDLCLTQHPVIVGLIAHLAGSVLQDDIVVTSRRLELLGRDVLTGSTSTKGGSYDPKVPDLPRSYSFPSPTVQLDRSTTGP